MNLVASSAITMSSREIAELVGSRHDKVKLSITRLSTSRSDDKPAVIALPPLGEYLDSLGRRATEYLVGKRDSFVVVAQLSPEFTARLVDRWQELEEAAEKSALPNFSDPVAAARAWADATEQKQIAQDQLAIAAPKAEFVDKYVDATGLKGFRQVAKLLEISEPEFRLFLSDNRIMYKLNGEWVPYANHIDAGRFAVKTGQADNGHAFNSAKFTAKGVEYVAQLWNRKGEAK